MLCTTTLTRDQPAIDICSYLGTCHCAPKVHRPHAEETSNDIHDPHHSEANEHSFHLLPQAMEPSPGSKNQHIDKQEGPQVAMEDQRQRFMVSDIVNFFAQVFPPLWLWKHRSQACTPELLVPQLTSISSRSRGASPRRSPADQRPEAMKHSI